MQLILNIIGMVIVTFLSRPFAEIAQQETGFTISYDEHFYKARIESIVNMVFDGIAVKEILL